MTVSEFLADCGLCPECGNQAKMLWYDNEHEDGCVVSGKCESEFCDSTWRWTLRTEET